MLIHQVVSLALAAATSLSPYAAYGDERLRALIEEALQNNPRVLESFADYQAARHRIPQAGALPDPVISATQFARSIETRVGAQQRMLALSQGIPGVGKRAAKSQLASKTADVHGEMYQGARAEIVHRVKLVYYDIAYMDQALAVNDEDQALLGHFEATARRRYAQGLGSQADVLRLQARITQAVRGRQGLLAERARLAADLTALRDIEGEAPLGTVRLVSVPELKLDPASLVALGTRTRPEVKVALLHIEEDEKRLHLARIRDHPDLTVGLSWGNIRARGLDPTSMPIPGNGKDAYAFSAGLTLPLFRRKYDAGVREASEQLAATRFAYRDTTSRMESEVRSITFRIETIQRQIRLTERALVPQTEMALASMEAAYSSGTADMTGLLDLHKMLLEVQLSLARLRADYLKAVADLERAIGTAVPEKIPL